MTPTPLTLPTRETGLEGLSAQLSAPPGIGRQAAAIANRGGANGAASTEDGDIMPESPSQQGEKNSHRPVRTKIANKDFQKFDIDPDAILRGIDKRTTVMVRHLQGVCARKEFLLFLDKCGLGNRYSFFYMPCKEHRNVPAGFAFVNFASPHDVHTLFGAVQSGLWREICSGSPSKSPAVSYARFQGHEDLVEHFSLSAVLHEQDPEKRPIFRPEVAKLGSSVHDLVAPEKVDKAQAPEVAKLPPGTDKQQPETAKQGDGTSPVSSLMALSSMQLQVAVEALLRKQSQATRQATGELDESSPKVSCADGPDTTAVKTMATLQNKSPAVKTMGIAMGDEEAFCTRMTGA